MAAQVDHTALFAATPSPYLVLGPDLMIVDVNRAYLEATGRTRDDLVGQHVFQAFPDNPEVLRDALDEHDGVTVVDDVVL